MSWKVLVLTVVLVGCVAGSVGSAFAAGSTVDAVLAVEYNSGVFTAAVLAHGPDHLAFVHLFVNDVEVVPDKSNHIVLNPAKNLTLLTLTKSGPGPVVQLGNVEKTEVTDMQGDTADKSVTYQAGQRLRQLVVWR